MSPREVKQVWTNDAPSIRPEDFSGNSFQSGNWEHSLDSFFRCSSSLDVWSATQIKATGKHFDNAPRSLQPKRPCVRNPWPILKIRKPSGEEEFLNKPGDGCSHEAKELAGPDECRCKTCATKVEDNKSSGGMFNSQSNALIFSNNIQENWLEPPTVARPRRKHNSKTIPTNIPVHQLPLTCQLRVLIPSSTLSLKIQLTTALRHPSAQLENSAKTYRLRRTPWKVNRLQTPLNSVRLLTIQTTSSTRWDQIVRFRHWVTLDRLPHPRTQHLGHPRKTTLLPRVTYHYP